MRKGSTAAQIHFKVSQVAILKSIKTLFDLRVSTLLNYPKNTELCTKSEKTFQAAGMPNLEICWPNYRVVMCAGGSGINQLSYSKVHYRTSYSCRCHLGFCEQLLLEEQTAHLRASEDFWYFTTRDMIS